MSILSFTGGVAADADWTDDAAVEVEAVGGTTDALTSEDMDDFPLTWASCPS